jgi:hypothetical protein
MNIVIEEIVDNVIILVEEITDDITIQVVEVVDDVTIVIEEIGIQGPQGIQGLQGGVLLKVSGEPIPSHTPVVLINNLAYKLDSSNPLHQFAFVGFSENGTSTGQNCQIKQIGEVTLFGWGLIANQHYLAGEEGMLITDNLSNTNFTKVIGYATTTNTLQIIKDSITINK